tara:strand:- start:3792 stop:4811 length:1020 start_codon:yes stop_codon:yes gene_type:complete
MKIEEIKLTDIVPDKNNPRGTQEEIDELAESLQTNGQFKPIDVEDLGNGKYFVTDGNRRFKGFEIIYKKTKKIPVVKCIVYKTLSPFERLIKQAQIDSQSKIYDVRARDILWGKIWDSGKYAKAEFRKLLGVKVASVDDYFDRMGVDDDIKKLDVNAGIMQETKSLKGDNRKKIIKFAVGQGKGAIALREDIKILKGASDELVDSFSKGEIDREDVGKMKDLPQKKQNIAIETLKHLKKQAKTVPRLVRDDEITEQNMNTPKMLAQKFLTNLEIRISKAVLEMNAIEGILDEFHKNKELNAQFDAKTKKPLTLCLKDLQKAIVPTSNMLEKTIKNWGSG